MAVTGGAGTGHGSQTLHRGLRILELLAAAEHPCSTTELSHELGVHRSIVYRLLRTLEDHHLVTRDAEGGARPSVGLSVLARSVRRSLQTAVLPELSSLADDLGMTAFLVVRDGDEAVTIQSVEPRHSAVHVIYRPGNRHPVWCGAPGYALLAGGPARPDEPAEAIAARARGWAFSCAEVLPGMSAVAAPLRDRAGTVPGAIAVVYVNHATDRARLGDRVAAAAAVAGAELA
jgi:DNA-binding IclR family transcriptional regulator